MRVLFIENAGNMSAGAYHSMIALIKLMRQYGVESHVAVPDRGDGLDLLDKNSIPYIKMRACSYTWLYSEKDSLIEKIKMPLKFVYTQIASQELIQYAKKNKIDLVHENTSACYIGKFVSEALGIPHIWHIREFLEEDFGMTIWNKTRAIKMMNDSDALITISGSITEKYVNLVEPKKLNKIYNGISIEQFYRLDHKLDISSNAKVLCVGRVCDGKGQRDVIKALSILKNRYNIDLQLYLAGIFEDAYAEEIMIPAKEAGIEANIHFLGQCNNIREVYSQMDILCMASRKEAFGRVTVEAMLAGMLVVGSNSGGTSEIVTNHETGFLYEPGNIDDMAETLKYVIEHSNEAVSIAEAGQEYAKQNFDAERNAREIYELYKRILSQR